MRGGDSLSPEGAFGNLCSEGGRAGGERLAWSQVPGPSPGCPWVSCLAGQVTYLSVGWTPQSQGDLHHEARAGVGIPARCLGRGHAEA